MSTPALVRLLAVEFASRTDEVLQSYIDIAGANVNTTTFGNRADQATALLAAHFLKNAESRGLGQITSEDNGQIQRSYADNGEDEISSTSYGRLYLAIQKRNIFSPIVV